MIKGFYIDNFKSLVDFRLPRSLTNLARLPA